MGIVKLQKRFNQISNEFLAKKKEVIWQKSFTSNNLCTSNRMIPMTANQHTLGSSRQK